MYFLLIHVIIKLVNIMITSLDNKRIKEVCKLSDKKYRYDNKLFVVEGSHLVEEAYKNNILLYSFGTKEYDYPNYEMVSDSVMKKLSNLTNTPSIIGVCKFIDKKEVFGNTLILDGIQDPGNLGTIIRSAVAFSIDTIVLSNDTVDLYNTKVLRATEGMLFNINIIIDDLETIIPKLKNDGYTIYGTDVVNGIDIKDVKKDNKYAIIMGNEGNGIKSNIKALTDKNIYIKMNSKCESLNVAVSTSIILYELSR